MWQLALGAWSLREEALPDYTRPQLPGRLAEGDVAAALVEAYRGIDPAAVREDGSHVQTVGDLLRAWFYEQEQRGPEGPAREEHKIAARTVRADLKALHQAMLCPPWTSGRR